MVNTQVRTITEPVIEVLQPQKEGVKIAKTDTDVEPLYLDYIKVKNHPYIVDHFKLGDSWKDKLGGFENEVNIIEDYFRDQIQQGQLRNDISAVKEKMEKIYKLCDIDKSERVTMQIEKLSAYMEFLRKTKDITLNHYKYGQRD